MESDVDDTQTHTAGAAVIQFKVETVAYSNMETATPVSDAGAQPAMTKLEMSVGLAHRTSSQKLHFPSLSPPPPKERPLPQMGPDAYATQQQIVILDLTKHHPQTPTRNQHILGLHTRNDLPLADRLDILGQTAPSPLLRQSQFSHWAFVHQETGHQPDGRLPSPDCPDSGPQNTRPHTSAQDSDLQNNAPAPIQHWTGPPDRTQYQYTLPARVTSSHKGCCCSMLDPLVQREWPGAQV